MKWAEKKEDIERKIGDRKISYATVGLNAYADGGLSVKGGDEDELGAKLGGKATFSPEVTITKDDVSGNESYTYTAKLTLEGKLSGNTDPLKGTLKVLSHDSQTGKARIEITITNETTINSALHPPFLRDKWDKYVGEPMNALTEIVNGPMREKTQKATWVEELDTR